MEVETVWAMIAVDAALNELRNRSGFDAAWDDCDLETQLEIQKACEEAARRALLNLRRPELETKEAPKRERLPPRPVDQRSTPDMTIRCALCDRGFLPGEVFSFPRECCEEGKKRDIEFNDYSTSTNR